MLNPLPKKILKRLSSYHISPMMMLDELDLRAGDHVLEIGLPVGFFAPAILEKVTKKGLVYVTAPNQEMLSILRHLSHHSNFRTAIIDQLINGKVIMESSLDVVIFTNILSKSVSPDSLAKSISKYLKPESQIVLIDWDTKSQKVGPEMGQRASREEAIRLFKGAGFVFQRILTTPGYHYGLVFSLR